MLNVSNPKTRVNVGRHCLFPQIATVDNQELGSVGYIGIATSKTKLELAPLNISSSSYALVKCLVTVIKRPQMQFKERGLYLGS